MLMIENLQEEDSIEQGQAQYSLWTQRKSLVVTVNQIIW